MRYVVVLDVDESLLDGDDSVENACLEANTALDAGSRGVAPSTVGPRTQETPAGFDGDVRWILKQMLVNSETRDDHAQVDEAIRQIRALAGFK